MLGRGINPRRNFLAVDVDGSDKFQSVGHDAMPTITAQRGRACAYWLSLVGRRITIPELFKFFEFVFGGGRTLLAQVLLAVGAVANRGAQQLPKRNIRGSERLPRGT